ncbi:DUF3152 domain-containing protein [Dietzia alimentaria]|uniref:DUF3152 domain-containing protein n=1 Tax=Dietzia alimentaria TaxID=665550 RepID=UPI000299DAC2|nr:DUF3152 domain-containing protein [Dietzia alimentaria]
MSDGRRRTSDGEDNGPAMGDVARGGRAERPRPKSDHREPERSPYYPPQSEPLRAPWDPEETGPGRRRSVPGARDHLPKQTPVGRFFSTWGWRAYAIPVLVVVTGLVIADAVASPGLSDEVAVEPEETQVIVGAPSAGKMPPSGKLPEGGSFTDAGAGTFRTVPGGTDLVGGSTAERFSYTVEIEDGVDAVEFGGDDSVARMVDATLSDPRSWTADGAVAFERIEQGEPTFRVSLASPMTVRENCGYDIQLESSCYNSSTGRVYLNLARWVRGARSFQGDIGSYRQYLVNHEVGHAVGYPAHAPCPENGVLAPIMMQQTFGVTNGDIFRLDPEGVVPDNRDTCRYNAWPFPDGPQAQR